VNSSVGDHCMRLASPKGLVFKPSAATVCRGVPRAPTDRDASVADLESGAPALSRWAASAIPVAVTPMFEGEERRQFTRSDLFGPRASCTSGRWISGTRGCREGRSGDARGLRAPACGALLRDAVRASRGWYRARRSHVGRRRDEAAPKGRLQQLARHASPGTTSRYDRRGDRTRTAIAAAIGPERR
jgi:hypothetical protein